MTTKQKAPPLPELLAELRRGAELSGESRHLTLSRGARVAFKVTPHKVLFSVSRADKRVGDQELIIFRQAARVPADAERVPADGQEMLSPDGVTTWWRVGWKWGSE